MLKKILFFQIIILFVIVLIHADGILIKKGPSYISSIDGIQRYLPNTKIQFKYSDTSSETYDKYRTTDSAGNIIGGPLPLSPGGG